MEGNIGEITGDAGRSTPALVVDDRLSRSEHLPSKVDPSALRGDVQLAGESTR